MKRRNNKTKIEASNYWGVLSKNKIKYQQQIQIKKEQI